MVKIVISFSFFQEGAPVNTWRQLRLLRRLTTCLTVSMVERMLTLGKHCVAHSMITVPIWIIGRRQVWG
jgi:hypothetical protein